MQDFLRWLASWKGIAVEDGATMQFELSSFPSGGLGLLVLVGILLILLFTYLIYRRDGGKLSRWQRGTLFSLRVFALLMAVFLLLEPNLVAVREETRQGDVILLVDTSQSMKQVDAFRRESVQPMAMGWQEIGIADPAVVSRFDLAEALLAHNDQELIKKLAAKNRPQLYRFSAGIEQLPEEPPPPPQPGVEVEPLAEQQTSVPILDLATLVPDGRYSNLGGSLRAALDKSRSSEIAAVIILSDGRRNAGPQGAEIARQINQRKIPHTLVLGVGDPSETQRVLLGRFEAPEKTFRKDPFEMRATVVSQGYESTPVTVKLLRIDAAGGVSVVRTEQVVVGGDSTETVVEFKDIKSEETGRFVYRVVLEPPSGELPEPERHQKERPVEVLGERTRVLLLAGGSSHEFQILRNLLIRDRTIDVSCWLQSADPEFPQDGDEDVRIEQLPAEQSELEPYDVAILIDPDPVKLTPGFCEMLQRHVIENGCGLWWVAGEKFSLAALKQTAATRPLVDLLPVYPDISYAESKVSGFGLAFTKAYPYSLTPEGADGMAAKITRIGQDRKDESVLLWNRLPGFHSAFPVKRPKPAATVLVEDINADPRLRRSGEGMPLIAMQHVGAGRVLFSGSDETYRWRSIFEEAYNWYWVQGIRYLFEGRIHAGNSRMRLLISDEKMELGDALTVSAECRDEVLQPLIVDEIELLLERSGDAPETVQLLPVEESPGTYSAQVRPNQTGNYRVYSMPAEGKTVEMQFQVVPAQIESEGPVDRAELSAIAAADGGQLLDTPEELLAAVDDIPSRSAIDTFRTPHSIWDDWLTVALLLGALSLEWILRKRFNLL